MEDSSETFHILGTSLGSEVDDPDTINVSGSIQIFVSSGQDAVSSIFFHKCIEKESNIQRYVEKKRKKKI